MAKRVENYINYWYGSTAPIIVKTIDPQKEIPEFKNRVYKRKKKIIRVNCGAVFGIVLSIMMALLMLRGVTKINDCQKNISEMEIIYDMLETNNVELKEEYDSKCDLTLVKKVALERGMIPVKDAKHVQIKLSPAPEEARLTWWQNFANSFLELWGIPPAYQLPTT